ncbi:hypothetical protein AVEN_222346-1 [Araneus ventricosus]|uniref:Uncharacterized protein n=1 Tax=Araneus ventricosus TaxID=182803 RepID=A0A4Y2WF72_ARAVE|nr:hypothetical protein AVEN_222346-1 [Araneus ventricosus]
MTRATPELASPHQTSAPRQWRTLGPLDTISLQEALYTTDLQWNQVFSLGPSGCEGDTFPQGQCDIWLKCRIINPTSPISPQTARPTEAGLGRFRTPG